MIRPEIHSVHKNNEDTLIQHEASLMQLKITTLTEAIRKLVETMNTSELGYVDQPTYLPLTPAAQELALRCAIGKDTDLQAASTQDKLIAVKLLQQALLKVRSDIAPNEHIEAVERIIKELNWNLQNFGANEILHEIVKIMRDGIMSSLEIMDQIISPKHGTL